MKEENALANNKYLRKPKEEHFIKTFNLMNFRTFNPKFKQCLTGTERGLFDYIILKRLKYVGITRPYGGNTILIDKPFKTAMLKEFNISIKTYEQMISKLVNDNVLNRISNGYFQLNPYVMAKGDNVQLLRELNIYRDNTLIFKDEKCKCSSIPPEDLCEEHDVDGDEREDVVDDTPAMKPIKGRNATLNDCFKK